MNSHIITKTQSYTHYNSLPDEIKINKECYSKYKYNYIKKNDLESLSWYIFYNTYIKKFI